MALASAIQVWLTAQRSGLISWLVCTRVTVALPVLLFLIYCSIRSWCSMTSVWMVISGTTARFHPLILREFIKEKNLNCNIYNSLQLKFCDKRFWWGYSEQAFILQTLTSVRILLNLQWLCAYCQLTPSLPTIGLYQSISEAYTDNTGVVCKDFFLAFFQMQFKSFYMLSDAQYLATSLKCVS